MMWMTSTTTTMMMIDVMMMINMILIIIMMVMMKIIMMIVMMMMIIMMMINIINAPAIFSTLTESRICHNQPFITLRLCDIYYILQSAILFISNE